jgi:hypothetical protein
VIAGPWPEAAAAGAFATRQAALVKVANVPTSVGAAVAGRLGGLVLAVEAGAGVLAAGVVAGAVVPAGVVVAGGVVAGVVVAAGVVAAVGAAGAVAGVVAVGVVVAAGVAAGVVGAAAVATAAPPAAPPRASSVPSRNAGIWLRPALRPGTTASGVAEELTGGAERRRPRARGLVIGGSADEVAESSEEGRPGRQGCGTREVTICDDSAPRESD